MPDPSARGAGGEPEGTGAGGRTASVQLIERLLPGEHAMGDQLDAGCSGHHEAGSSAEATPRGSGVGSSGWAGDVVRLALAACRTARPCGEDVVGRHGLTRGRGGVCRGPTRRTANPVDDASPVAMAPRSTMSMAPMWKRLRGPGPPSKTHRAAPVKKRAMGSVAASSQRRSKRRSAARTRRRAPPCRGDEDGGEGDGAHDHPRDLGSGEAAQAAGCGPVGGHEERGGPGVGGDAARARCPGDPRVAARAGPAVGEVVGADDQDRRVRRRSRKSGGRQTPRAAPRTSPPATAQTIGNAAARQSAPQATIGDRHDEHGRRGGQGVRSEPTASRW